MYMATVLRNLSVTKLEIKIKAIMGKGWNGTESLKTAILKLFSLHEISKGIFIHLSTTCYFKLQINVFNKCQKDYLHRLFSIM